MAAARERVVDVLVGLGGGGRVEVKVVRRGVCGRDDDDDGKAGG